MNQELEWQHRWQITWLSGPCVQVPLLPNPISILVLASPVRLLCIAAEGVLSSSAQWQMDLQQPRREARLGFRLQSTFGGYCFSADSNSIGFCILLGMGTLVTFQINWFFVYITLFPTILYIYPSLPSCPSPYLFLWIIADFKTFAHKVLSLIWWTIKLNCASLWEDSHRWNPLAYKPNACPGVNEGLQLPYASYRHFIQPLGSHVQGTLGMVMCASRLFFPRPGTLNQQHVWRLSLSYCIQVILPTCILIL